MINYIKSPKPKKMSDELKNKMKKLTPLERKYFMTMWPKSGVMYITSKPGIAKSAISREIANKMGFRYIDIRLSMLDETDVGLYPNLSEIEIDGDKKKCLDFVVPRWAIESNKQPTIIHFEELNRAQLSVRNAALQILLERRIGTEFSFNDNVLMMASGNLGDEDGTDVEEFDAALNNRLIHFRHNLTPSDWIDNFAQENCHPIIVSFIKSYPECIYQNPTDSTKAYATPRSWKFLSDWIVTHFGMESNTSDFISDLTEVCHGYIGNTSNKFLKYCQDMNSVTINDVINNYGDDVKARIENCNRDKKSELLQSLKEFNIVKLGDEQLQNIIDFLKTLDDDEIVSYLIYIIDEFPRMTDEDKKHFFKDFEDHIEKIRINQK